MLCFHVCGEEVLTHLYHVWNKARSGVTSSVMRRLVFFESGTLTNSGVHEFLSTGWPEAPGSVSAAVELQACPTTPSFFRWVQETQIQVLLLTQGAANYLSHLPAQHILLIKKKPNSCYYIHHNVFFL